MPVYHDKAKARFRFEFDRRINGIRYRSTKLLPKGWSQAQADHYEREESGRLYAQATGLERPRLPLAGAIKLYLDHRCPELRNGKKTAQDLAHLLPLIETAMLDQVSELATVYELEHQGKLAPATIRNRLAYLKAAVRYAYRKHGYGDRDYSDRMMLPSPKNERQRYEKLPALNRLWKAMHPEARALFKMAFYMGLRWRAELLPRTPGDVHRIRGEVWLQIGTTKNGQPVMKPVHPAVLDCLKRLPFPHGDSWYYDRWQEACEKAGLADFHPHDLRHSLASEIRARGGTLQDVAGALHHQSLQAARRYSHLYPERLRTVLLGVGGQKNPHRRRVGKRGNRGKVAASA